jgi:hypothetical protein
VRRAALRPSHVTPPGSRRKARALADRFKDISATEPGCLEPVAACSRLWSARSTLTGAAPGFRCRRSSSRNRPHRSAPGGRSPTGYTQETITFPGPHGWPFSLLRVAPPHVHRTIRTREWSPAVGVARDVRGRTPRRRPWPSRCHQRISLLAGLPRRVAVQQRAA